MFKIRSHENKVVWRLFAFSLTIATSYVVARTVGDSLFLSRIGNEYLALVFVLAGLCTATVASCWYLATRRFSVSRTIQMSSLTFAGLSLGAWYLLPQYHHAFWLMACIYLLAEVKGCINAINIISALNTKLGREASKPAWAMVGLAAPLAAVVTGGILANEAAEISLRSWLLVAFGLDVVAFVIGTLLGRTNNLKTTINDTPFTRKQFFKDPIASGLKAKYVSSEKFRFWIGVLIAAKIVVLTIISYEWKSTVNQYFQGKPDNLVLFFGTFYGVVGLATISIQVLLTSRFLTKRNFRTPILLMPILLFFVATSFAFGLGLLMTLIATTLGKALDAWRRSVHDTTLNLIYTKIKRNKRRFSISFNSGFVKPLSEVAAACLIYFTTPESYRMVMLVVLTIWFISAIRLLRLIKVPQPPSKPAETEYADTEPPNTERAASGTDPLRA